ncbi:unnamed protein product [Urochloa decumbens]|uniref:Uncharacterized protein n=1 Tax=Urochloa decumbens TaxID=240449 RepID=A0ABC8ZSE2_9POAL
MRGMVVMAAFLFAVLLGSLALPTQCRPHLLFTTNSTVNDVNSTSLDETKVHLIFCAKSRCLYFGPTYVDCYCCPNESRKEYCHTTLKECRANCAACNPRCSP